MAGRVVSETEEKTCSAILNAFCLAYILQVAGHVESLNRAQQDEIPAMTHSCMHFRFVDMRTALAVSTGLARLIA